jgi:hypothetical protein
VHFFAQSDSGQDNGTITIDVTGKIMGGGANKASGCGRGRQEQCDDGGYRRQCLGYGRAGISFSTLDNYQANARFAAADPAVGSFDSNVAIPDVVGRISAGAQLIGKNNLGVDLRYGGAFGSGLSSNRQPAIEL